MKPKNLPSSIATIADILLRELKNFDIKAQLAPLRDEGFEPTRVGLVNLGVLQDLSPDQQQRLAQVIHKIWAEGETDRYISSLWQDVRVWRKKHGRGGLGVLGRGMTKAHRAIHAVGRQLQKFPVTTRRELDDALNIALAILDPTSLETAKPLISALRTAEKDAIGQAMTALYDFFVTECNAEKKEAEVRVGKIGNHFWHWSVEVIERPVKYSDKSKGCPAVCKAVRRRNKKVLPDTSAKTR